MAMKKSLLLLLLLTTLISVSQSFQKVYEPNTFTDVLTYKGRLYVLENNVTDGYFIVKKDLTGNVIWSNKYAGPGLAGLLFFSASNGRINIGQTGGSATAFFSIDTLNGQPSNDYSFNHCPPNPQNRSDKLISFDNGLTVKLGCNPSTLKQTIYTTNAITGNTLAAVSVNSITGVGNILQARITKAGKNSILLYGITSVTNLMFCMKITDPVTLANTGVHILKKQLPSDLELDFGTDIDSSGNVIFLLFRSNSQYTYIKTDSTLSSFNSYSRPISNNFVSHIAYKNNTLYSAIYKPNSSTKAFPILSSVNSNFVPIQNVLYPLATVGSTGSATYPNRNFKIANTNSDVYFTYSDSNLVIVKSNNYGMLNCTNTTTLPAFTNLELGDSLNVGISTTVSPFMFYANITVTTTPLSPYTFTTNCLTTGSIDLLGSKVERMSLVQYSFSEYVISSTFSLIDDVVVYDINGRLVQAIKNVSAEQLKVDLSSQPNGVYLLRAKDVYGHEKAFKIIKL
jgi:hypothetical protein